MRITAVALIVGSLILLLFPGILMDLLHPLVIAVTGLTTYLVIRDFGQSIPRLACSFIALLCCVQLLGAPLVQYEYFAADVNLARFNLQMQVDIEKYFSFTLPAVMIFVGGLILRDDEGEWRELIIEKRVYRICLVAGLIFYLLRGVLRLDFGALNFLVHMFTLLLPASLVHAHVHALKNNRVLWKVFTGPLVLFLIWMIAGSIRSGMYANLIFWGVILGSATLAQLQSNLRSRIIFFCAGLLIALSIQMSKNSYRELAWVQGRVSAQNYFNTLVFGIQQTFDEEKRELVYYNSLIRLNQGWHLSHVLARSEEESIRLNGRRCLESALATVVPRFLWSSKPRAGGAENIANYTYINLQPGTSMNISFFGDFYLDFGRVGGVFAVFIFGLIYRKFLKVFFEWARRDQIVAVAYPILVVGIIQVETDLLMLMNHAFKVSVLLWVLSKFLVRIKL